MHPLAEIRDFLEIEPNFLTSGQPTVDQLHLISAAGCRLVINLAAQASPDFILDEGERLRALGLDYVHIPVDWNAPTRDDLDACFAILKANQDRRIFIHCARNMRVSAFVFLYRVLILGLDEAACRADMERIWQPNEIWEEFIRASLESHRR